MLDLLDFCEHFHNDDCPVVFMEELTVANQLKMQDRSEPAVKWLKKLVKTQLPTINFFQTPVGKKLLDKYVNFFTYQILIDPSWQEIYQRHKIQMMRATPAVKAGNEADFAAETAASQAGGTMRHMWQGWGDYLVAMGDRMSSKINTTSYVPSIINREVEEWHTDLAAEQGAMPSGDFTEIMDLSSIGWSGWKWVSLDKGYCSLEAKAMGHCGNAGARAGDNILSLRDPKGKAHLTFIVNNKMLGESKGRANSKPSERYHPVIVALLRSPYVDVIKGGGYEEQYNFHFDDLDKETQQELLKEKPHINDLFGHITNSSLDDKSLAKQLGDVLGYDFDAAKTTTDETKDGTRTNTVLVLETAEDFKELETKLEKFPNTKIENLAWLEEPESFWSDSGNTDIAEMLRYYVPKNILAALLKHFKDNDKYKDDEEYQELVEEEDLAELIDRYDDDGIQDAFSRAESSGTEVGSSNAAWKDVQNQLGQPTENGFYVDFNHPWTICLSLISARALWAEMQREPAWDFTDFIDIEYRPSDNYWDFDKDEFVERLEEELHQIDIEA